MLPTTVDSLFKGMPGGAAAGDITGLAERGWNLLRGDLPFPVAALRDSALVHNSDWMRRFLDRAGVSFAPHGKTTMSPQLFHRQLADGAWGITVATVNQLRICREAGIGRVLMANQLVDPRGIHYVCTELAADPDFDFYVLVDSVPGVTRLAEATRRHAPGRPLQLLLEGGVAGGRTGCRDFATADRIAAAVAAAPGLSLRGIEGYEGVITGATPAGRDASIRAFLGFLVALLDRGRTGGWFQPDREILVSAGGSAFYDLVTRDLNPRDLTGDGSGDPGHTADVRVVLRGGCYLTHDSGFYARLDAELRARSAAARATGPGLQPALEVWSMLQSSPEPGLAFLGMGRRDVSFDIDLPVPRYWSRGGPPAPLGPGHAITALNDHHAWLQLPPDSPLQIGDMVGCGISHPCTTFDKWRLLYLVNDQYDITSGIRCFF